MANRREISVAGESIWLCGMTGVVAGEKKFSEGQVYQRSGGSTVNTQHEFWLVASNGEELLIHIFNSKVSVREGQCITAIWGAALGKERGPFLILRNLNAQTDTWLFSEASGLIKEMGLSSPIWKRVLIGLFIAILMYFIPVVPMAIASKLHLPFLPSVASSIALALVFLAVSIAFFEKRWKSKERAVKQAVVEAMNMEAQQYMGPCQNQNVHIEQPALR